MSQVQRVPIYIPERRGGNNGTAVGEGIGQGLSALAGMLFRSHEDEKARNAHKELTLEAQKRANAHDMDMAKFQADTQRSLLERRSELAKAEFDHQFDRINTRTDALANIDRTLRSLANIQAANMIGTEAVLLKKQQKRIGEITDELNGKRNTLLKTKFQNINAGVVAGVQLVNGIRTAGPDVLKEQEAKDALAPKSPSAWLSEYEVVRPEFEAKRRALPGGPGDMAYEAGLSKLREEERAINIKGMAPLQEALQSERASSLQNNKVAALKQLLNKVPADGSGFKELMLKALAGDTKGIADHLKSPQGRASIPMYRATAEYLTKESMAISREGQANVGPDGKQLVPPIADPEVLNLFNLTTNRIRSALMAETPLQEIYEDAIINTYPIYSNEVGKAMGSAMIIAKAGDYQKAESHMLRAGVGLAQKFGTLAPDKAKDILDSLDDLIVHDESRVGPMETASLKSIMESPVSTVFEEILTRPGGSGERVGAILPQEAVNQMPGITRGAWQGVREAQRQALLNTARGIKPTTEADLIEELRRGGAAAAPFKPSEESVRSQANAPAVDYEPKPSKQSDIADQLMKGATGSSTDVKAPATEPINKASEADSSKILEQSYKSKSFDPASIESPYDGYFSASDAFAKAIKTFVPSFDSADGIRRNRALELLGDPNDRRPYAAAMNGANLEWLDSMTAETKERVASLREQSNKQIVQAPVNTGQMQAQGQTAGPQGPQGPQQGQPGGNKLQLQQAKPITV